MAVIIKEGNVFDSDADIICHQVNCQGVMGSGVAKEVRERFPNVYEEFPIVKDTTPNMMNPRLYTTSYNKPQGQQFDDTAVLSFIKLQYT